MAAARITPEEAAAELARRRAASVDGAAIAQTPAISKEDVLRELARRKGQAAPAAPPQAEDPQRAAAREIGRRLVAAEPKGPLDALRGAGAAVALGAGGGAFEVANAALRNEIKSKLGVDDARAKELADEVLGAAARARPGAFGVGYGVGAVGSGGALLKGAQAVGKAAPIAAKVASITPNAAKVAAGGAVASAVSAKNRGETGEDVVQEAAVGAVAPLAIQAAAKPLVRIGQRVFDKPNEGFRALEKVLKRKGRDVSAQQLQAAADEFKKKTGRTPSAIELLGERGALDVAESVSGSGEAAAMLIKAGERNAVALQDRLARQITPQSSVTGVSLDARAASRAAAAEAEKTTRRQAFSQAAAAAEAEKTTRRQAFSQAVAAAEAEKTTRRQAFSQAAETTRQAIVSRNKNITSVAAEEAERLRAQARAAVRGARDAAVEAKEAGVLKVAQQLGARVPEKGHFTVERAQQGLDAYAKKYWAANRNAKIALSKKEIEKLADAEISSKLPPDVYDSLRKGSVRLEDLDNLRKDLSAAGAVPGSRSRFAARAREVSEIISSKRPDYAEYLAGYAARAQDLAGVAAAKQTLSSKADRVEAVIDTSSKYAAQGFKRAGARILQQISQDSSRTEKFAKDIVRDEDFFRRVKAVVGEKEADILRSIAKSTLSQSKEAVRAVSDTKDTYTKRLSEMKARVRLLSKEAAEAAEAARKDLLAKKAAVEAAEASARKDLLAKKAAAEAAEDASRKDLLAKKAAVEGVVDRSQSKGALALRKAVALGASTPRARTSEFLEEAGRLSPTARRVAANAARAAEADIVQSGPESAARTARALSEDSGLFKRLSALDAKEATRLRDLGEAEAGALRSSLAAAKASKAPGAGQDVTDAKLAVDSALSAVGAGSLSFKVSAMTRLLNRLKVPPVAAEKLARLMTDPDKSGEAIDILRKAGVQPKIVADAVRALASAGGRGAAQATTEDGSSGN